MGRQLLGFSSLTTNSIWGKMLADSGPYSLGSRPKATLARGSLPVSRAGYWKQSALGLPLGCMGSGAETMIDKE